VNHGLAAMSGWIKRGQLLRQAKLWFPNRPDEQPGRFHRKLDWHTDAKSRRSCEFRGNPDGEAVAPALHLE
jgi:hypothetical protein